MSAVIEDMQNICSSILLDTGFESIRPASAEGRPYASRTAFYDAISALQSPIYDYTLNYSGLLSGSYHLLCTEAFLGRLQELNEEMPDNEKTEYGRPFIQRIGESLIEMSYGETDFFELEGTHFERTNNLGLATLLSNFSLCFKVDDHPIAIVFQPKDPSREMDKKRIAA